LSKIYSGSINIYYKYFADLKLICRWECVFSRLLVCENHFNFHNQNAHKNNHNLSYGRQIGGSHVRKQMIPIKQTTSIL